MRSDDSKIPHRNKNGDVVAAGWTGAVTAWLKWALPFAFTLFAFIMTIVVIPLVKQDKNHAVVHARMVDFMEEGGRFTAGQAEQLKSELVLLWREDLAAVQRPPAQYVMLMDERHKETSRRLESIEETLSEVLRELRSR